LKFSDKAEVEKKKIILDEGESTLVNLDTGRLCAQKLLRAETAAFFEENA
jgi:hypothetical protein